MRCGNCCRQFRVTSTEFGVRGKKRVWAEIFLPASTTDFMTWVKICGITNLEDALTAVDAGADALGFVFYDKSPRRINVETAREIVANLPAHVEKVGVLVGESQAGWVDLVLRTRLTAVQLYL